MSSATFRASSGHSFEPEFTGPTPRAIPDSLLDGPYAQTQRRATAALLVCGVACLVLGVAPGIDVAALYVLPLRYLGWIGAAFLLGAGSSQLRQVLRKGPYRYVRDGIPIVARVLDLVKAPSLIVNGEASQHAFTARLSFVHPDTGGMAEADVRSPGFASAQKDRYDTPFKVGDDVTAVYLPGRFEKTLQVYAFLDLSPTVSLRTPAAPAAESPWKLAALLVAVIGLFVVAFGNVYIFGRYNPVDFEFRDGAIPVAAGAVFLGGGLFAGLYMAHRREQAAIARRSHEAVRLGKAVEMGTPFLGSGAHGWFARVALSLGLPLMGGVTVLCWCFLANAVLDRSPSRPVPAVVTQRTMTTHAFLFRQYELKYELEGVSGTHELLTTPAHLAQFESQAAVAHVRDGRLGWPWVETVVPAAAADAP